MMKLKKLVWVIFLIVLLVGCNQNNVNVKEESSRNQTLIYASEAEFEVLNPALEETNVNALLFRGLMRFDEKNIAQKDIAKSYEVSEDGLTYIFHLKEDVYFHDGKRLTAEDVKFTLDSILADENMSTLKADFEEIETVEVINENEVKIKLNNPFVPFLEKLTVGIIPKHAFSGDENLRSSDFNKKPIGIGPYKLLEWESGQSITLSAFDQYYGKAPSIKTVVFKFIPDSNVRAIQLRTGEVDIALLEPNQVKSLEKLEHLTIFNQPTSDYRAMMYNMKFDLWKDHSVRKAFNYAVNREEIIRGILNGYGTEAYSPIQNNPFNNEQVEKYSYNLAKAEQLLDESGWLKEKDGFRYKAGNKLQFTMTAPISDGVRVNIAQYLSSQFRKIGADVKVDALDWSVIKIEECEAFILGWGSPFDADDHTYKLFHSSQMGEGYNFGVYSNPTVDRLLEAGRITTDVEKRKQIYAELQKELEKDPPFNYLVYLNATYGVNQKVAGIKEKTLGHHGAGFLWNVEEWTMVND